MFCTLRVSGKCAAAGIFLLLAVSGMAEAQTLAPGFVEGHLRVFPLTDIKLPKELGEDGNLMVTRANYADYPLVILSSDGQKEIKRFTADGEGHYRVPLPPGEYILDVRVQSRVRGKPIPFAVQSGATAQVNIDFDTGIR
jgi:hypothetical protein